MQGHASSDAGRSVARAEFDASVSGSGAEGAKAAQPDHSGFNESQRLSGESAPELNRAPEFASASRVAGDAEVVVSESVVSEDSASTAEEPELNQQSRSTTEAELEVSNSGLETLKDSADVGSSKSQAAQNFGVSPDSVSGTDLSGLLKKSSLDKQADSAVSVSQPVEHLAQPLVEAGGGLEVSAQSDQLDEQAELTEASQAAEPAQASEQKQKLIELLKPEQISLSGDWDLSKWCYWIAQAGLEPSVASLAKKGLMQGSIAGRSQLSFAVSSKIMVEAFGYKLKTALEESLSGIEVVYEFGALSGPTPETEQNKRKRLVQQQAEHYLREESLIKVLETAYQADLNGVTLSLN